MKTQIAGGILIGPEGPQTYKDILGDDFAKNKMKTLVRFILLEVFLYFVQSKAYKSVL